MSGSPILSRFELLSLKSRAIHGHMYVLPVAAWILQSKTEAVGASEVMGGLDDRVDRQRVIEALAKLADLGALVEFPRLRRNSPRMFAVDESPYWDYVAAEIKAVDKQRSDEIEAWSGR